MQHVFPVRSLRAPTRFGLGFRYREIKGEPEVSTGGQPRRSVPEVSRGGQPWSSAPEVTAGPALMLQLGTAAYTGVGHALGVSYGADPTGAAGAPFYLFGGRFHLDAAAGRSQMTSNPNGKHVTPTSPPR